MPGSIDKAPKHDEATGWSCTAISYQRGETDPPHQHLEGQLLFATRGVMLVDTEGNRWDASLSDLAYIANMSFLANPYTSSTPESGMSTQYS